MIAEADVPDSQPKPGERFLLSPLIRFTLLMVYLALVLPLPALAPRSLQLGLGIAAVGGLVLVSALLSGRTRENLMLNVQHVMGSTGPPACWVQQSRHRARRRLCSTRSLPLNFWASLVQR